MVVHDGARPCVGQEIISNVVKGARRGAASVAGCRIRDAIKIVEKGITVSSTVDRSKYWAVQTPQAFPFRMLRAAYAAVEAGGKEVFDDAQAVGVGEHHVRVAVHEPATQLAHKRPEDLQVAAALLKL